MSHDVRQSKKLSWLLRHGAIESGLAMDGAGWCAVTDVLALLGLTQNQLSVFVRTNDKRRLQIDGERIRACQGHSAGTPVHPEALEASWSVWTSDGPVWHGTSRSALNDIAQEGLTPQRRTHVHLTESKDSRVAKRAHVEVTLEIDPGRLRSLGSFVYEAPNGVLLTRSVPPECVVNVHPLTRATRREESAIRALFALPQPLP